jgi:hypothetical protein
VDEPLTHQQVAAGAEYVGRVADEENVVADAQRVLADGGPHEDAGAGAVQIAEPDPAFHAVAPEARREPVTAEERGAAARDLHDRLRPQRSRRQREQPKERRDGSDEPGEQACGARAHRPQCTTLSMVNFANRTASRSGGRVSVQGTSAHRMLCGNSGNPAMGGLVPCSRPAET